MVAALVLLVPVNVLWVPAQARLERELRYRELVDASVNQTLSRTVITAGTTLLSVVALYLFGGEVLEGFAFTMMIGIISGTYSTVFIASAIAIILQGRKPLKGQPAAAAASTRPSKRRAS